MDNKDNNKTENKNDLDKAKQSVLVKSDNQYKTNIVKGYDFNNGLNYSELFSSYKHMGFQSSALGKSIDIVNKMISYRLSHEEINEDETDFYKIKENREKTKCTVFLGYTSNLVSSGLREIIRYLAEHKMIDAIVTTAGGIEEDFIKCLAPTYMGEFNLDGKELRSKGMNRIGNLLVPNDNYCKFEDWINPRLDKMLEDQIVNKVNWTPSKMIEFLGKEIDNKDSIYYWCAKNNIPVYCPALTDGSIGDMMFFHGYADYKPRLKLDIVEDIIKLNKSALEAKKTGMIILGGGIVKHHINNANLMRNGADYAVYINTAQEFDGSDAGARPDEAVSWGKIRQDAESVKIYAEATLVFPILVGETFVKRKDEATKINDKN